MEAIVYSFNIGNIIFTKMLSWGNYSKKCLIEVFFNIPYMGINYFYCSSIYNHSKFYFDEVFLMNLSGKSPSEKCIVLCNYYGFWHKRGNLKKKNKKFSNFNAFFCAKCSSMWVFDGLLYCFCYFISKRGLNSEIVQI